MNMVFVSFTFGLALPLLFPMALFGVFNMYVTERIQFAYFYKQPPVYDNKLNESAISFLKYAPIMLLISSYF